MGTYLRLDINNRHRETFGTPAPERRNTHRGETTFWPIFRIGSFHSHDLSKLVQFFSVFRRLSGDKAGAHEGKYWLANEFGTLTGRKKPK